MLLLVTAAQAACPSGTCVILPLGDSITDGYNVPGGYRIRLEDLLGTGGYAFNFVGALRNGPWALADKDHEGHSGWRIDQIQGILGNRLLRYQPDVVLIHLGTNDIGQGYDVGNAPDRLDTLVSTILAFNPDATVLVAGVVPFTAPAYDALVVTYNAGVQAVVEAKADEGYDVHFVDMHTDFPTWLLADGVHPTAAGYNVMADRWYATLASVLP